ncbi:carboxyvinyl-carboxyphosphonate phosphorylmutase [Musa troglodytarum]|uniref:Photosystem I reaction center subunit N, chloroplastic n=1 Tax=Musa troglodytarum TaxID=320322 RepID=A0A9E7GAZ8_9LILI|nr:carboxyvinyl-carboxyphosphonate phosphorylmutase [Musa troglodytarum]
MADSSVAITLRPPTAAAGPRKTRMHRLIEEEGIVLMPGIYDALSAAVLQSLGFRAGFVSGYAVSASRLGMPDIGLLTPPEMADAARAICAAAPNVAFIVDADTGGGNALNVQRTVKDIIATGAAGLFLEDQVWPKKCVVSCGTSLMSSSFFVFGNKDTCRVIPAEEHAAKIAAAREAIGDADFFLIARTDARATAGGLPEAIARANLYMEAGADACFVEAPRSDDELREVCKKTNGFRAANMLEGGFTPLHTPQELKEMGFHLIVHSTTAVYASARALIDVLKVMKEEGTSRGQLDKLTTFEEFNSLIGLKTYNETGARFEKFRRSTSVRDHFPRAPPSLLSTSQSYWWVRERGDVPIGREAISPYPHSHHNPLFPPISSSYAHPPHLLGHAPLKPPPLPSPPVVASRRAEMAAINSSVLACNYALSGVSDSSSKLISAPSSRAQASASSPKLPVIRAQHARAGERVEATREGRRAALVGLAAALFATAAATSPADAGIIDEYLEKSKANKFQELNDKKRLATSGANFARAYTVEFGTCKFPENFTGCQDLAKQKKVPFLSDDLEIECEGKDKFKCGSNVFWKWTK